MKHNGFEYVDLGLPSGTKWATCNIGADKETDCGLYFSWGETKGYDSIINTKQFSLEYYKFSYKGSNSTFTKYNDTDGKTVLDLEDDAAYVNMGGRWHMPSKEQIKELITNTEATWEANYNGSGASGESLTSNINGNKLFLPACAGLFNESSILLDSYGRFWSNSISLSNIGQSFYLGFHSHTMCFYDGFRYIGRCVRGVFNTFWI